MNTNVLKHLLWIVLLLFPQLHSAQQKFLFSKNYWHRGEVTLKSGESHQGLIKYHLEYNLVEVQNDLDSTKKVFSSSQLESFSFRDTLTKIERLFYALPVKTFNGYRSFSFYELIGEGDYTILTREKIVMKPHNQGKDLKGSGKYDLILEDDFYLLDDAGEVKHCGKIPELSALFDIPLPDLKSYIKNNKVNMKQRKDFMTVVTYYSAYTKKFNVKSRIALGE
jgi:hypothetical protein